MLYSSTTLVKGRGQAIVVTTGMQTEIGRIAKRLLDSNGEALKSTLDCMASVLFGGCYHCLDDCLCCCEIRQINDQGCTLCSLSTAIAVIPEGLIAVVTLTQAFLV